MNEQVPPIPLNIVEYLERIYPDKAPRQMDSLDVIRHKTGQVSVHQHLRAVYEEQVKNFAQHFKETR